MQKMSNEELVFLCFFHLDSDFRWDYSQDECQWAQAGWAQVRKDGMHHYIYTVWRQWVRQSLGCYRTSAQSSCAATIARALAPLDRHLSYKELSKSSNSGTRLIHVCDHNNKRCISLNMHTVYNENSGVEYLVILAKMPWYPMQVDTEGKWSGLYGTPFSRQISVWVAVMVGTARCLTLPTFDVNGLLRNFKVSRKNS